MVKLKIGSNTEKIPVAKTRSGLSGEKIRLNGHNKSKRSIASAESDAEEALLRSLARGETGSVGGQSGRSGSRVGSLKSGRASSRASSGGRSAAPLSVYSSSSSSSSSGSSSGNDSDSDVSEAGTYISLSSSGSSSASARPKKKRGGASNPFDMEDAELEEAEKQDILARMHTLKMKGVRLSKNYTPRSSLNELRMEIGRIEHEHEMKRSIQKLRRYLLMFVAGLQKLTNMKQMPALVRGRLNGYSDYVMNSIEEYDPAFERLSEKYGGVVGLGSTGNPLMDIGLLMLMQMVMFIFIESQASAASVKPLSADEIKQQYPTLIKEEAERMAAEMVKSQDAELRRQKEDTERAKAEWERRMMQQANTSAVSFRAPRREPIPMPGPPIVPNTQPDPSQLELLLPPPQPLQRQQAIPPPTSPYAADSPPRRTTTLSAPLTPVRPNTPKGGAVTPRSARSARSVRSSSRQSNRSSKSTPGKTLDLNLMPENPAEIPFFDGVAIDDEPDASLPATPANRTKLVEMPENARSTRKGRLVKVTNLPEKSAMKPPTEISI